MSAILAHWKPRHRRWMVALEWKPADLWIGVYFDRTTQIELPNGLAQEVLQFWVCVLPMLPIHVTKYRR